MPHLIARRPDGTYVHRDHEDFDQHAQEVSGKLRKVTMWNDDGRNGHDHAAVDYVPVEHLDEYVARAYSNQHRDVAAGDRAWDHVEVSDDHDAGPGGDMQHWHDESAAIAAARSQTMALTATMKVTIANAYIAAALWLGLTSTAPGATTGTEISGGSPAYARVAAAWGTPNGATGVTTGTPAAVNVASGTTVVGVQYWSASTAGTYEDGASVTSQAFASQGTYTVTPTLTPA